MKSIWKGAITFGLVNIPIRLYSAVQDSSLDLDMLDSRDLSNIKYKRVNANTGKEVPYEKIVKGYMYNDEYVIVEPDDFEAADAKKTHTIEILNFVKESEIDTIYYETPFYIEPEKGGEKAYAIFRDALIDSGRVGVSTFVLRNREALAVVKPYEKALLLARIRFEEEIRDLGDLNLPVSHSKSKEVDMAKKLIDQLTTHFNVSAYKDTYTHKLLDLIKKKAKGVKPRKTKLAVVHRTPKEDLMTLLKASLNEKKKKAS